jgi:hypothetical protein
MTNPADPGAFARSLAEMEAHINDAEARGEDVPSQAYLLVARLRELINALQELDGSLKSPEAPKPDTSDT